MRYIVQEGSVSGHCCFEFTIIDTKKDSNIGECFEKEDAELICNALNEMEDE